MGYVGPPAPDPKPGEVYRHYKGGIYTVIGIGQHTESDERLVVYDGMDSRIWCRPVKVFTSTAPVGYVRRFTLVTGKGT